MSIKLIREVNLLKKLTSAVACALAAVLVLSGCTKSDPEPSASSTASPAPVSAAPPKEKLTLNWMTFTPTNNSKLPDASKDFVKKTIEEKFNVTLNIEYGVSSEEMSNKLHMRFAAGDSPDMFHGNSSYTGKYTNDGVLADLTKYVTPQNMPNYFKWVSQDEINRYKIAGAYTRAPVPFPKDLYITYYVRKDWLDKLNLKVPTTYDEMIEVMKAFTFNDPDGNGKQDTYGLTAAGNGVNVTRELPQWYKHKIGPDFFVEGDQFIDASSDIRVQGVLDDIKKMLDLKIIDPDWFLNKPGQQLEKVQQGKAGIFWSNLREAAFDNSANSVKKKTIEITGVKNADFVPFNIAGDLGMSWQSLPGVPFMFGVKTPENKIKRSMEILDWMASEEGYLLTHYGQEGIHYKKEGKKVTLDADAIKRDITDNGNFLEIYGNLFAYGVKIPVPLGLEVVDTQETDHDRAILEKLKTYKYALLGTNLSPIPGLDVGAFRTKMKEYYAKILFEEKDASNWPKYRQELMTKYSGKELFSGYAEQVGTSHGKKLTFKWEN
ncbi:MAG: transporter substrate-binding protein [Paenibacillus sp.]|jgi:ABC-type glycerol-3-phosphate transport system substrate-binding protein|nr:transporter substrate-binding protein [Paenibacillus sp.]